MASPAGWREYVDIYSTQIVANYQSINNSSGFTGIPIDNNAYWWSSTTNCLVLLSRYSTPFLAATSIGSVRCLKGELQALPVLTTNAMMNITPNSAIAGGNVTITAGSSVAVRGICWSTSPNPTIANSKTTDGSGPGSFTSSITGLIPATTYYVRAYATNTYVGTAYGNEITFRTPVTDVEGNVYNAVNIGTQVWLIENLKTTRYSNGDLIGTTTPASFDIRSETAPKYQWAYNGNESNVATYGRLYTWYAVNDGRNVCPDHWHVPAQAEWTTLTDYLGGLSISGGKLKEAGTTHWISPNTGATNETGFTALPGGYRLSSGGFGGLGSDGAWRSSTVNSTNEDWTIGMGNSYTDAYGSNNSKRSGYSVRCIQGDLQVLPILSTTATTNISHTTAETGGNITSEGCSPVTGRGVCWSTSTNPTIANNKTINGSGIGTFTSSITGLIANTVYYVRSYATNSYGTNYGNEQILKTYYGTISDIDENVYNTVIIGTQTWIAENLGTTKFNDGTVISLVTNNTDWANLTSSGYSWYNNDPTTFKTIYGALYNSYAIKTNKLCPTGWHVSTNDDWTTLTTYLGGTTIAGGKLKEAGTSHWLSPNEGATNESGFTGLPGGIRDQNGSFSNFGYSGIWWSPNCSDYNNMRSVDKLYSSVFNQTAGKSGLSVRCIKDEFHLPTLSTTAANIITRSTAFSGGNITSDGNAPIIARGVCWSTSPNPTITNNKTTDGNGTGTFTSSITGLTAGTVYHVRAYAINSLGTIYGDEIIFKTYTEAITDIDGNSYNTVVIGNQTWIAENLKTTRYNDGTSIPFVTDKAEWISLSTPGYCWCFNDADRYKNPFGALYNWYTINTGKLCPTGWHVPKDAEWTALTTYLGGENITGGKLKEEGTFHWQSPNLGATNENGFTALPGGVIGTDGYFDSFSERGFWWSADEWNSTQSRGRDILKDYSNMFSIISDKKDGFSVRCIKDN